MSVALDTSSGELVKITLAGSLGRKFGRTHFMAVRSAAEAVRALSSQLRGFEAWLTQSKDRNEGYAVFYGRSNLHEDDLHNPCGKDGIKFVPMVLGAKSPIVRIIVGIILVVVGTLGSEYGLGFLVPMGWGMIVGGVIQMLTPVPKGPGGRDGPGNTPSYAFNGPVNTQAQGHPVSVLYGELIVGSAVLSGGIEVTDIYVATSGWDGTFGGLVRHILTA